MADIVTVLHELVEKHMSASSLTDLVIGTVYTVSPLSVQITPDFIVPSAVLYLTETVTERKINFSHTHTFPHTHAGTDTDGGSFTTTTSQSTVTTTGDGTLINQPVDVSPAPLYGQGSTYQQSGIINPGLAIGDKVLMLRIQSGQAYIIMSRVEISS